LIIRPIGFVQGCFDKECRT